MVVQSLPCLNTCADPVNSNSLDPGATTGHPHSIVSGVSVNDNQVMAFQAAKGNNSGSPSSGRRSSARIQKLNNEKALRLRSRAEDKAEDTNIPKKTRVYQKKKANLPTAGSHSVQDTRSEVKAELTESTETSNCADVESGQMVNMRSTEVAENGVMAEKSAYAKVTETLRTFNKHYLQLIQEEEKRCARVEADHKTSKSLKVKKGDGVEDEAKRGSKRPDLKAITKMMEANAILYPNKRFGSIPGVDVGHQFFSRAEMVAVGFHSHWLNGIDFIGQSAGKVDFSGYTLPLAVAIVLSGQYEDDLDNCEDVVYTGQGGNNLLGNKRQIRDQVMERGNLALKNCMEQCVPVRVVRGHQSASSYVGKVYTYDGLYKVVHYWAEKGVSGFTVYKFRLKRLEGQPLLTTNQVHFTRGRIPNSISEIRGLVCEDVSGGQENIPIPATNLVEDPPIAPTDFTYCKSIQIAKNVKLPRTAPGCECKDTCRDPKSCACARLNGSDFPYVHRDGGRLIEPKAVVFECGPNCGCGPGCVNRTSQRGLKYRLEVFRTPKKGWAVRSWDYIPSGAPVCEYIGVLMKTDDIDPAAENSFVFDIDCLQTMKGLDGRERRLGDVSIPTHMEHADEYSSDSVPEYCIDAVSKGNVARFINHSCQPNLFVQCVLSSHHDIKFARVVLFAADNIPPLKELTYDYGYVLDSVMGPDGKIRQMPCYCGAADCRKRLF